MAAKNAGRRIFRALTAAQATSVLQAASVVFSSRKNAGICDSFSALASGTLLAAEGAA